MESSLINLIALFISLIAIAAMGYFLFKRLKKRRLEIQFQTYQALLQDARQSRLQYVSALEASEKVKFQIDALQSEVSALKGKQHNFRVNIKKQIQDLRKLYAANLTTQYDMNIRDKKKMELFNTWKAYNVIKAPYNQKFVDIRSHHEQYTKLSNEARQRSEKWFSDKKQVMDLYGRLSGEMKLSNPREVLLKGDKD